MTKLYEQLWISYAYATVTSISDVGLVILVPSLSVYVLPLPYYLMIVFYICISSKFEQTKHTLLM